MRKPLYGQYFAIEGRHWWFRGMRDLQWRVLRGLGLPSGRALDVGCGTGYWLKQLQALVPADGCDNATEALRFCQERGVAGLTQASATHLPFAGSSYDLVTALGLVEHVERDDQVLDECFRVLRPGGHLLVLTSGHPWLWSQHDEAVHHVRRYTRRELGAKLAAAGFEVKRLTHANLVLLPAALALRLGRTLLPVWRSDVPGSPDLFEVPSVLNATLYRLLRLEASLLRWLDLPAGLGIVAVARRPVDSIHAAGQRRALA